MSSFFLPVKDRGDKRKRKQPVKGKHGKVKRDQKPTKRRHQLMNEEIQSDSEDDESMRKVKSVGVAQSLGVDTEFSEEEETSQDKRLRLAKEYLTQLEEQEREEGEEVDHDAISHRLEEQVLEQSGKLHKKVADSYMVPNADSVKFLKGHKLSVTSVAVTPDNKYVYSGSKDCCVIKWSLVSGNKEVVLTGHRRGVVGVVGHTGHVLALAVSSDGKFLASGGADKVVHIWDVDTNIHQHTFRGHKDSITGLVFQRGTHELFSCSMDRTVKVWNLNEMTYVETLFGHQDAILGIDCLSRERPVTVGANDRTLRVWKIIEESQLVYHGHKASIDAVKMMNEDHFISGSQDGNVCLWNVMKKKPLIVRPHNQGGVVTALVPGERWVTSVAALSYTDLLASGSSDGLIHFWKCGENLRSLDMIFSLPMSGFVNAMAFSSNGQYLVAGVGQEHKLGRWWKNTNTKNGVAIISLNKS